jgi:hypothetical protein
VEFSETNERLITLNSYHRLIWIVTVRANWNDNVSVMSYSVRNFIICLFNDWTRAVCGVEIRSLYNQIQNVMLYSMTQFKMRSYEHFLLSLLKDAECGISARCRVAPTVQHRFSSESRWTHDHILVFHDSGGRWSALLPGRFILGEISMGTHSIRGWMGPRVGETVTEKSLVFAWS